eukprot:scaffold146431_cov31-Tisochrysis_lutea.AAC.1
MNDVRRPPANVPTHAGPGLAVVDIDRSPSHLESTPSAAEDERLFGMFAQLPFAHNALSSPSAYCTILSRRAEARADGRDGHWPVLSPIFSSAARSAHATAASCAPLTAEVYHCEGMRKVLLFLLLGFSRSDRPAKPARRSLN